MELTNAIFNKMVKKIFFRADGWFVFINFTKFDSYCIFAVIFGTEFRHGWESLI